MLEQRYDKLGRKIKKKRTREEFLAAITHDKLSVSGKPFDYSTITQEYVQSRDYITYICPDHGPVTVLASGHLSHKCSKCSRIFVGINKRGKTNHRKFTLEKALNKAKKLFPQLDFSKVKKYDPKGLWTITCPQHGEFTQKVFSILWDKTTGCPSCRKFHKKIINQNLSEKKKHSFNSALSIFNYKVIKYTRAHEPAILLCPQHGKFRISAAYLLSQGSICQRCRSGSSTPEIILRKSLLKLMPDLKIEMHRRDLLPNGYEIDIYLPDYNVGVEVNGVRWHHSGNKDKAYHLNKTLLAENKGFQLLHFTDLEITHKLYLICSMILAKCGIFKYRFGARKTQVQKISYEQSSKFLESNHIQGAIAGYSYYGLFINFQRKTHLISVAVFGKPRFNTKYTWELLRFATRKSCQVIGGLSKLISAFAKINKGILLSYAARDYSDGQSYLAAGFTLEYSTTPSYSWHKRNHKLSRYQTQKSKLNNLLENYDPSKSEQENMIANKYWQLYNCGNMVFTFNLWDIQ